MVKYDIEVEKVNKNMVDMDIFRPIPKLVKLPSKLNLDNAVSISLEGETPIFKASPSIQSRVETLLQREKEGLLTAEEKAELDSYEEIDDYLSFINRVARNLMALP